MPSLGELAMEARAYRIKSVTDPSFTKFWVTFTDPVVETDYAESIREERVEALRFFATFGGLLFLATIGADYLYLGASEGFVQLMILRTIAGMICLLAAVILPLLKTDLAVDIAILLAALTISAVLCVVPYYRIEEAQIHQLVVVITLIIFYSFLPVRLSYQLLIGVFMTVFLLGVMVVEIKAKPFDIAGVAIFITLANGVGFFTTRKAQRLSRLNYWKVILLNREIEHNEYISNQLKVVHQEIERSNQQLRDAVDNVSEGFVLFDKHQRLILCNDNFKKFYRLSDQEAQQGTARSALMELGRARNAISIDTPEKDRDFFFARCASSYPIDSEVIIKLYDGRWVQIRERRTAAGNIVGIHADITKLQTALEEIKTLKGILPICTNCKKIRDDSGYWEMLEAYLAKHSDVSFSHGICPTCIEKLYGNEGWYVKGTGEGV